MLHIVTSVTYSENSFPTETHYARQKSKHFIAINSFNLPIIPRRLALL